MKQSVTLLCLLAWTTGAPDTSRHSTETFGRGRRSSTSNRRSTPHTTTPMPSSRVTV